MASLNSYAAVTTSWGKLLEAIQRTPDVQPSIDAERQTLAELLVKAQELKARQDELTALRQEVTQQLNAVIKEGKDSAITIRSVVRGKVGPRNERLVHFSVAPLRQRKRKTVQKPTDGEDPEVEVKESSPSVQPAA